MKDKLKKQETIIQSFANWLALNKEGRKQDFELTISKTTFVIRRLKKQKQKQ